MIPTPIEIALGKTIVENTRRTILFLRRRASTVDAGGSRLVTDLTHSTPIVGAVGRVLLEVATKDQWKLVDTYFASAEFGAALRQIFACRITFGPSFRERASRSVALVGAGLRMYIPAPSSRMRNAFVELTSKVLDLVDEVVTDEKNRLLTHANDEAFNTFLQNELSNLELVIDSVSHTGDARDVVAWLDRYTAAASATYSKVRTPHWNDQVIAPIDRVYVPARFRFISPTNEADYRVRLANSQWQEQLTERLRLRYPVEAPDRYFDERQKARERAESLHDPLNLDYGGLPIERLVVLGDPGAGKTTLSQRLAHDLLAGKAIGAESALKNLVPFIVTLREYAATSGRSFSEFISDHCAGRFQCRPPDRLIEFLLATGRAFVVFDGLDELPDTSQRSRVSQEVEAFCAAYPNTRVLVTSRLVGYEQAPLDNQVFAALRILPFEEDEVARYALTWFLMDHALNVDDRAATSKAFISTTRSIADLRSNPLLLALLCNLYRATGYQELPRSRPAILEKCALVLFDRWDRNRGIGKVRFEEDFAPTVSYLAYTMFTSPKYADGVSETELMEIAVQFLFPGRFSHEADARSFCVSLVEHCRDRAWVFTDVGTDPLGQPKYQFTHRTFLEYFTAAHVVRKYKISDLIIPVLWPAISTASWGLVPLLVLQILARNFDDDAGNAVQLLIATLNEASDQTRPTTYRFLREVLANISLPATAVEVVVDEIADHSPGGAIDGWSSTEVSKENRATFERRVAELRA